MDFHAPVLIGRYTPASQGALTNLSLGGGYLDTVTPLPLHQRVMISVMAPSWPAFDVEGIVTRRTAGGTGLRWTESTQEKLIPLLFCGPLGQQGAHWWAQTRMLAALRFVVHIIGLPERTTAAAAEATIAPYAPVNSVSVVTLPAGPLVTVHVPQPRSADDVVEALHGRTVDGGTIFAIRGDYPTGQVLQLLASAAAQRTPPSVASRR
jgi:hypothetical protein